MASQPFASRGEVHFFPAAPPMPAVARILSRHDRASVEAFIAIAIDLLDTLDGSPDAEDDDPEGAIEDDEDDDPDTSIEDNPGGFDPEQDYGVEEYGEPDDNPVEDFSDPVARAEQRSRIRRSRCVPDYTDLIDCRSGAAPKRSCTYRLKKEPNVPSRGQLLKRKRGVPTRPRG